METIAFYSYKGGVGRSLLVANTARFLGMLGKRVVALDLDIEAPGLHYKLGRAPKDGRTAIAGGAVPYLLATAKGAENPPPLKDHMIELAMPEGSGGSLHLMPAGPAPSREYWTALKQLREQLRFDDPSGTGLAALFDLHARIQDELKPDYLLIDSRTGVTELGGLATTALANTVVCLLVPNQESVDGTLAIVEALITSNVPPSRDASFSKMSIQIKDLRTFEDARRKHIRVVPVVTRVMGEMSEEGQTAVGIKHLVRLTEIPSLEKKGESKPFVLPHDSALGAKDKIVAGEQKASSFSPLHKAYIELFQHLFPQERKEAGDVLRRLEAVAALRQELTERRRSRRSRHRDSDYHGAFEPWEDSAIDEGVVIKSKHSAKTSRYADLVCRGASGETLIVVEFTSESKEAEVLEFWADHTKTRCVILLCPKEKATWTQTKIYFRPNHSGRKLEPADRNEPPFPMEFEIYTNPGEQLIEEILEALRRGNEGLVPDVIAQWRDYADLGDEMMREMRGGRWRPVEARRILDGLAATEKAEVGSRVLRYAARAPSLGWDDHFYKMKYGSGMSASVAEDELFAPLFWRLPVDAVFRYLSEREHPGWSPCLAGHQLLAENVMGLRYDPVRSALMDGADLIAGQLPDEKSESDDDEERTLHVINRRLFRNGTPRLAENPPPNLVWDQQYREDRYWSGAMDDVSEKAREAAKELMGSTSKLRTWLRGKITRDGLVTSGLLGRYDPTSGRIELYPAILDTLAPLIGLQPRYLKSVVFIQVSVAAMAHQARDYDGQPGFGFAGTLLASPFQKESPAHIILTQYFAFRLIERLGDTNLMAALEKLSEKQPEPYRRWRKMRHIPVEKMRAALLRARLGESALGLPGSECE